MAKEAIIPNQGIRERHLNIVYFIDSSKSHSVRINLRLARWLFAGAIGLVLWSILSLGWIISLGRILQMTRSHLGTALTSIFDYQVKYDHIFDVAYPENTTQGYYANGSHLPGNSPTDSEKTPASAPPAAVKPSVAAASPAPSAAAPVAEANQTSPNAPVVPSEATKSQGSPLAMDIRNPSLVAQNGKMTLLFDISNKNPAQKAEGYIWSIATIKLADGSAKTIAAPAHSRLNQDGSIDEYSTTYKFSIQKFKRKDFSFAVPADESWTVTDLKITFVNSQGKQKQTTQVTVPVKFTKSEEKSSNEASGDEPETSDEAKQ